MIAEATKEKISLNRFFTIKKDDNGQFKGFRIDRLKFLELLYNLGFRRLDVQNMTTFVQIYNDRILREVTKINIQDSFFSHLEETYDKLGEGIHVKDLINYMLSALGTFFNEEFLYRLLPKEELTFARDTQHEKFIFFKENYVRITKEAIEKLPYHTLQGYIWQNEIINFDYTGVADFKVSYFEQFIHKICGNDANRIASMQTIIGYNLHSYFEGKLKASVFTDSKISADDEPNGRTGKTLFCKALSHILGHTITEINGKDFDPQQATKYQSANLDTKIIVINDAKKFFDVETIFNDITEGIQVKKLYKEPFRIQVKMIITTNKTIKIEGDSSKDRFIEFEFSDYFNKSHSPEKEFKHWFFRDWDKHEWSRFYYFIMLSIKQYFTKGLTEATPINLLDRKLRDNTNTDFIEWIESASIQHTIKFATDNDTEINKNEFYEKFTNTYTDFKNKLTQNKFSRWLKYWGKYNKQNIQVTDTILKEGRVFKFNYKK